MRKRVQPPHVMLAAMLLIAALHIGFPITWVLPPPWNFGGLLLVIAGLVINEVALRALKRARTTTHTHGTPSTLVQWGVYGVLRHPIYLGMCLVVLGAALILGTLTPLIVVPLFAVTVDWLFVSQEERRLADTFGAEWDMYTARVRRWL